MQPANYQRILVTDFDGTLTQRDFYSCVVEELLSPEDLQPWHDYAAGRITHFESLRRIFAKIRASESQLLDLLPKMEFDPQARAAVDRLRDHQWNVVVVSNGCGWYIRKLLQQHGLELNVHTNPGEFSSTEGLQMELPAESPYFSAELGISKAKVVRDMQRQYPVVAFAGDGRPDMDPAMLIPPEFRFARGWLAEELDSRRETYQDYRAWSQIADCLCDRDA